MINQLLGPKARMMLYLAVLCGLLTYLLIMYFPVITGNIIGNIVSK